MAPSTFHASKVAVDRRPAHHAARAPAESSGARELARVKAGRPVDVAGVGAVARAIGNRATAQLMSERAPGAAATVASVVGELPRDGGAPLAPATAERFAARLGHDFSHVRVHTGKQAEVGARRLGARAFTLGSDIYLRGASSDGPLLAHELTHVMQHDRGQLPRGGEPRLSRASDATEREASRNEREASRNERAHSDRAPRLAHEDARPAPSGEATLVQRAIGFELQTGMQVIDPTAAVPMYAYGTVLYIDARGEHGEYFRLVSDTGDVATQAPVQTEPERSYSSVLELVFPHTESLDEVAVAIRRADLMRRAIGIATDQAKNQAPIARVIEIYEELLAESASDDSSERAGGIKEAGAVIGQQNGLWSLSMGAAPQMTFGVDLEDITMLVRRLMPSKMFAAEHHAPLAAHLVALAKDTESWKLPGDATGLVFLVRSYLDVMGQDSLYSYPKEATPLMARTDFHSMYEQLGGEGKRAFAAFVEQMKQQQPNEPVFQTGFLYDGATHRGPRLHDWLDSIIDPSRFALDAGYLERIADRNVLVRDILLGYDSVGDELSRRVGDDDPRMIPLLQTSSRILRTPRTVPPNEVIRLLTALGRADVLELYDDHYAERDLMSRDVVGRAATSMGSLRVRTAGSEAGKAILENRMMPQWPAAADSAEAQAPWRRHVLEAFIGLSNALPPRPMPPLPPPRRSSSEEHKEERGEPPARRERRGRSGRRAERSSRSPSPKKTRERSKSRSRSRSPVPESGRLLYDSQDEVRGVAYGSIRYQVVDTGADAADSFYAAVAMVVGSTASNLRAELGEEAAEGGARRPQMEALAERCNLKLYLHLEKNDATSILELGPDGGRSVHLLLVPASKRVDLLRRMT